MVAFGNLETLFSKLLVGAATARCLALMLVPLGPRLGASHLPLPGPLGLAGTMRGPGDALTRLAKGRDLFVGKYRRLLGAQRLKGSRG